LPIFYSWDQNVPLYFLHHGDEPLFLVAKRIAQFYVIHHPRFMGSVEIEKGATAIHLSPKGSNE
jgi:hypothetical protein